MASTRWTRVKHATAAAVAPLADLEPPAAALLTPQADPSQFHEQLVDRKLWIDAIRFLAQALPPREAVFWALQCVRETAKEPSDGQMLAIAERWVKAPSDDGGRAGFALAEKAGFKSAAAWVAVGCFWSGPSLAPQNVPAVPPGPGLAGKAASGAILLAAVSGKPQDAPKLQKRFLDLGAAVASGATPLPA
jgi:hypothetical protein